MARFVSFSSLALIVLCGCGSGAEHKTSDASSKSPTASNQIPPSKTPNPPERKSPKRAKEKEQFKPVAYDPTGGFRFVHFGEKQTRIAIIEKDLGNEVYYARIYDLEKGNPISPAMIHPKQIAIAAFSPDGTRVVTTCHDDQLRVWDASTGKLVAGPLKHGLYLRYAAFSMDGKWIVACTGFSHDSKIWRIGADNAMEPIEFKFPSSFGAFHPDGRRVAVTRDNGDVCVYDLESGKQTMTPVENKAGEFVSYSRDGRLLLSGGLSGELQITDADSGASLGSPIKLSTRHFCLSPDGKRVVASCNDNTARIIDIETRQEEAVLKPHRSIVRHSVFNGDGSLVVTTTNSYETACWNAKTGKLQARPKDGQYVAYFNRSAFFPDGKRIVTLASHGALVWDAMTGDDIRAIRVSPD